MDVGLTDDSFTVELELLDDAHLSLEDGVSPTVKSNEIVL